MAPSSTAASSKSANGPKTAQILKPGGKIVPSDIIGKDHALWQGDVLAFLKGLPMEPMFDLVVTSPPYNIGKEYETRQGLDEYINWQESIIDEIIPRFKKGGSTSRKPCTHASFLLD